MGTTVLEQLNAQLNEEVVEESEESSLEPIIEDSPTEEEKEPLTPVLEEEKDATMETADEPEVLSEDAAITANPNRRKEQKRLTQVQMTDSEREVAKKLGNGKISRGIRNALLAAYKP